MSTSYSDWVYYGSGCCALRIKWTYTDAAATCKVAATLQRWDKYAQSGQGSATLSQTSNGSKSANFGSCSNDSTRDVVALGTYTYSKGTSAKTVTASVSTNDWFATITDGGYVTIGAISFSKTFTISKKTSYTVKYAANGGSSTPSNQTKWYGTALTLAAAISHANAAATAYTVTLNHNYSGSSNGSLSASRTTKYAFSKWKATNGTQYAAKGSYTANAATTMTAQWTTSTTTAAVTLTSPTRSGYTFVGWATSSTGAKAYNGGASYTPSGNVTLYAVWNRTVKYDANGGSGAPGDQTGVATSAMTLSSTIPTREGYRFLGWNTNSGGTGTNYAAGASYPAQNPGVTLYAKWQVLLDINVTSATRCTSNGTPDTLGTYCKVQWNWENGDGSQVAPLFTVTTTPATSTGTVEVEVPDSVGAEEVLLSGIGPQTEYTVTVSGVTVGTSTATASLPKTYTAPTISSVKTNRVAETSQGSGEYVLDDAGEVLKLDVAWAVCQSGSQLVNMSVQAVDTDGDALFKVNGIPTPHALMTDVAGNYGGTSTFYVDAATFLADKQYTVTVYLGDVLGNSAQRGDVLTSAYFPLDFLGDAYYYEPTEDASCDPTKTYYVMGDSGWYEKFDGNAFVAGTTYYEKTGPKPGHGVSFGAPCKDEGFHVHMPADFSDKVIVGQHNVEDINDEYAVIIGNGTSDNARSNAATIDWNGQISAYGGFNSQLPVSFKAGVDTVSATTYYPVLYAIDTDGVQAMYSQICKRTDDQGYLSFVFKRRKSDNTEVGNGVYFHIAADGTRSIALSDGAIWRNAMGASSGIWPISLGGTDSSSASQTSTVSSVITVASGVSVTSISARRWGPICVLEINGKCTAAKSGTWTVGTLKSGFVPLNQVTLSEWGGNLQSRMSNAGVISINGSRAKDDTFSIGGAYFWKTS